MPKSQLDKSQKTRQNRGSSQRPPMPPPTRRILAGLLAAATLFGGAAAVATFLPRMTVAAHGPIDPSDPSSIAFTVTNTNVLPLCDMEIYLAICIAAFGDAPFHRLPCDISNAARIKR